MVPEARCHSPRTKQQKVTAWISFSIVRLFAVFSISPTEERSGHWVGGVTGARRGTPSHYCCPWVTEAERHHHQAGTSDK